MSFSLTLFPIRPSPWPDHMMRWCIIRTHLLVVYTESYSYIISPKGIITFSSFHMTVLYYLFVWRWNTYTISLSSTKTSILNVIKPDISTPPRNLHWKYIFSMSLNLTDLVLIPSISVNLLTLNPVQLRVSSQGSIHTVPLAFISPRT